MYRYRYRTLPGREMESTLLLASAGGFFIGTYPIFVKTPVVLAANVHPIVFQLYKSFWVAVSGALFIVLRWVRGEELIFAFTWWAVVAALVWVPAGACLVAAVPRAGVGAGVLIFDGCTTILSFAFGLVVFGERLKAHTSADGGVYFIAPLYLVMSLVGMAGLTLLPKWLSSHPTALKQLDEPLLSSKDDTMPIDTLNRTALIGYAFAVAAGAFSAVQYAVVTVGKKAAGLLPTAYAKEALNPLGSWTLSFGAASLAVNGIGLVVVSRWHEAVATPPPTLKVRQIWREASAAGVCYTLSVVTTTLAVERGGNAVVPAQRNAVSLITSGLWGLVYYGEVKGIAAVAWCGAAALTMASVVLLGFEKGV